MDVVDLTPSGLADLLDSVYAELHAAGDLRAAELARKCTARVEEIAARATLYQTLSEHLLGGGDLRADRYN